MPRPSRNTEHFREHPSGCRLTKPVRRAPLEAHLPGRGRVGGNSDHGGNCCSPSDGSLKFDCFRSGDRRILWHAGLAANVCNGPGDLHAARWATVSGEWAQEIHCTRLLWSSKFMTYSREGLWKSSARGYPAVRMARRKVNGVTLGVMTYSYRALQQTPGVDRVDGQIAALKTNGEAAISNCSKRSFSRRSKPDDLDKWRAGVTAGPKKAARKEAGCRWCYNSCLYGELPRLTHRRGSGPNI